MHKCLTKSVLSLSVLTFVLGVSATGWAQTSQPDADPWRDVLSADHPGFADSSSTVRMRETQGEFGADVSMPPADQVDLGVNALVRYGVRDWVEARIEMPSLVFGIPTSDGESMTTLDTIEVAAKLRLPLGERVQVSFLPTLIAPSGTETSPYDGLGGQLGLLLDVSLTDTIGFNANIIPRAVGYEVSQTETEYDFELDAAAGLGWSANRHLAVFVEGFATMDGNQEVTPGANGGVVYTITPNILVDLFGGARFLPTEDVVPFVATGFVYRYQ